MTLDEISPLIAEWARMNPRIKRVFVFGSRARSENRPDSDLDVAVELDRSSLKGDDESGGILTWMDEEAEWKEELQRLVPFTVHLEQLAGESTPAVQKGITQSGRLMYEKKKQ